ncbi:MAG: hypothetical protein AB7G06_09170 [Bdellovibrionales bacterium]
MAIAYKSSFAAYEEPLVRPVAVKSGPSRAMRAVRRVALVWAIVIWVAVGHAAASEAQQRSLGDIRDKCQAYNPQMGGYSSLSVFRCY